MVVRRGDSTIPGKLVAEFRMRSTDFQRKGVAENNRKPSTTKRTKHTKNFLRMFLTFLESLVILVVRHSFSLVSRCVIGITRGMAREKRYSFDIHRHV